VTDVKRFRVARNVRKEATTTCPECGRTIPVFFDYLSYPLVGEPERHAGHCHDCCCDVYVTIRVNVSIPVTDTHPPEKKEVKNQDGED
jgi:hypothetical protein